jgi:hypothetical protein
MEYPQPQSISYLQPNIKNEIGRIKIDPANQCSQLGPWFKGRAFICGSARSAPPEAQGGHSDSIGPPAAGSRMALR